jgi:hypothetical protein
LESEEFSFEVQNETLGRIEALALSSTETDESLEAFYLFQSRQDVTNYEIHNSDKIKRAPYLMNVFESNIFKPTIGQRYPTRVR